MAELIKLAEIRVELRDPRPVSVNKLYRKTRDGTLYLTDEGRHFKDRLAEEIAQATSLHKPPWKNVWDSVYKMGAHVRLIIELHLERLYNGSWKVGGSSTDGGEPMLPFRKVDAPNYEKIISDAIERGTGINDACQLSTRIDKYEDKTDPRIVIIYGVYE